jgi:hypothetical protein
MNYRYIVISVDSAKQLEELLNKAGEQGFRAAHFALGPNTSPDEPDFFYAIAEKQEATR